MVVLAAFAALIPVTLVLGYRHKTPAFAFLLTTGLLLQVVGFSARVILRDNVADKTHFALFLAGTTLGSSFVAAAIFTVLPHAISVYGTKACGTKPKHVAIASAALVLVIVILEVAGAILIPFQTGAASTFVLVAALFAQTAALLLFIGTHIWMSICLSGEHANLDLKFAPVYQSARFRRFLFVLQTAALLLLGHSIYRAVELTGGIAGPIFQHEVAFMVANGAVPLMACILLAVFSPGAAFGKAWGLTSARARGKRNGRQPSPIILYDRPSPRKVEGDSKQTTPTSAGHMPLEDSTMATTVTVYPATQTTAQPSPSASVHKNTPSNWRELRRMSAQARKEGLPSASYYSPKSSPTFDLSSQSPEPSPTYQGLQQQLSRSGSRRSSKMAQTPSHLVHNDNLW